MITEPSSSRRRSSVAAGSALVACLVLGAAGTALAAGPDTFAIQAPAGPLTRGEVFVVALRGLPAGARVEGWWRGAPLAFAPVSDSEWLALAGVDLDARPRRYLLTLAVVSPGGRTVRRRRAIEVVAKRFGVQHLSLPAGMVELDAETLARVGREAADFSQLWPRQTPERLWKGAFLAPVPGELRTPFGVVRFVNGQRRAAHSGVDVKAALGEPVRAINRGRVALVGDGFFNGLTVVLDHGEGLYSMYFHLSEQQVALGELVEQGSPVGLAGSTGRSTGPHLHWGVRLGGARVDPLSLIAATEALSAADRADATQQPSPTAAAR
jgi:murein DD-endopeptidase MepM/ murein hydrolase activator NlpD